MDLMTLRIAVLLTAIIIGSALNLSLILLLALQEAILYAQGKIHKERMRTKEKMVKEVLPYYIKIILLGWFFWMTTEHTIDDFYIMGAY